MQVDDSLKQQQLCMFERSRRSNRAKRWQSDSGSSKQLKCSYSEQVQDPVQMQISLTVHNIYEVDLKTGLTNS